MAKARIASKIQSKLGTLIFGEQFTGKSTLASQLAYFKRPDGKPFRLLYLDPESGSIDDYLADLESNGVDIANIYIVYTQSLGEVRQYISRVKNNEDFPVLDDEGNETDDIVLDADGNPFRADAIVVDGAPYGFGCVGCARTNELSIFLLRNKGIPVLELKYPDNQDETYVMVNSINEFIDSLDKTTEEE